VPGRIGSEGLERPETWLVCGQYIQPMALPHGRFSFLHGLLL
jgi:hypothetical protein